MDFVAYSFALVVMLAGYDCAHWSSSMRDGQMKYACEGGSLILPWAISLTGTQTIKDIQWYYHGQSDELIAIYSHNNFVPMPAFAQRVHMVGNAGIELSRIIRGDMGNYSVEVTGEDSSGTLFSLHQTVIVQVDDELVTTDGSLKVRRLPQPMLDPSTQQWALVLNCGTFTYVGHPPFDVRWKLPDNSTTLSTNYAAGDFQLFLSNPVEGGAYICQITPSMADGACVGGAVGSSVYIDGMEARMSLLEASQAALKQENTLLKQEVNLLTQQIQGISTPRHVSFMATLMHDKAGVSYGSRLVFDQVTNNLGSAYDPSSGDFVAPYSGIYFLAISTRCLNGNADAEIVKSEGQSYVCRIDSDVNNDAGSCQAVAQLARGERVWVQAFEHRVSCYRATDTVFTGFLINENQ